MDGRSNITGNAREWRRLRALELRGRGWHQRDIAEALGCPRGDHLSLARTREGRRPRGPPRPPVAGPPAPALARAETPDPGVPLARRGGVWLSRSGLDPRPHRSGHRGGVGRPLPQEPCRQAPRGIALDASDADSTGRPA